MRSPLTKADHTEFARWLGRRSYAVRVERFGLARIQAIARENGRKGGRPPKTKEVLDAR